MNRNLRVIVVGRHKVQIIDEQGQIACSKHSPQLDGDTFYWETCDGAVLEIGFDPNHNPFEPATQPPYTATAKGNVTNPAKVDKLKTPGSYDYTIKIDGVDYDDPQIIIDPGR